MPRIQEFFRPSRRKTLISIVLAAFFFFFPIVSRSVIAFPFFSLSSDALSAALNILAAYVFAGALAVTWENKKRRNLVALAIILVYLTVPKVGSYSVGDMGGVTETYCDCIGAEIPLSQCCGSNVNYCVGVCRRDERTETWPKYGAGA